MALPSYTPLYHARSCLPSSSQVFVYLASESSAEPGWIDSEEVRRWRRQRGAAGDSGRVFGCALGYLGDPAVFVGWNVAGDLVPVVRDVVDRVRAGGDRVWEVIMYVPRLLGRVSESDLACVRPGHVRDSHVLHGSWV